MGQGMLCLFVLSTAGRSQHLFSQLDDFYKEKRLLKVCNKLIKDPTELAWRLWCR